jgi:acyl dehydratase
VSRARTIPLAEIPGHVGKKFFQSPWTSVDAAHLSQFAWATYLDPEVTDLTASKNNPLGATLVDGFLLLSMLTALYFNNSPLSDAGIYGFNYGLDRVRFTHSVFVGQSIRCTATLVEADPRPDGSWRVVTDNVIEIQGEDKPAMVARWVCLYARRDDGGNAAPAV